MIRTITCVSLLIALMTFVIDCKSVSAQTVVIPHFDRGWYDKTGFHSPTNTNYVVGDGGDFSDNRNFFVFNLAAVTQPIASAKLALFVPSDGSFSGDPSENYELHDVVTSMVALLGGTGGIAAHTDLGSGVVYGSRTMTAADNGSVVEITLNSAAIAALDAATGFIGIGGSLTTLDGLANNEFAFSMTGSETDTTELRITLVPEPSSLLLCVLGFFATQLRRKRTRLSFV